MRVRFEQIVNRSILSDPQFLPYKQQIADVLRGPADAAMVWLGSNEFRANYGSLYGGTDPTPLINRLADDLGEVLDFVQGQKAGIKLAVVNLPDLGATPDKQAAHPDPVKRANVTAATVFANQAYATAIPPITDGEILGLGSDGGVTIDLPPGGSARFVRLRVSVRPVN